METTTDTPRRWETFHQWRKARNLSQEEVSIALNLRSQDTVSRWERMQSPPCWNHLPILSEVMGIPLPALATEIALAVAQKKYRSQA